RVQGAGIEQGGRGAHEVERRKYFVELDGTGFTIDFVERQAHGDAHEEDLRQLDSAPFQVQEVAVIKRLQTQIVELRVALCLQCACELVEIEQRQILVEQTTFHAQADVLGEVLGVTLAHGRLRHFLSHDFLADRVQQQAGRYLAVGGVDFHAGAGGENGGLEHFLDGNAVVQILDCLFQDGVDIDGTLVPGG